MNKSHLTAITRTKLSKPIKILRKKKLIVGDVLDYGCGKGFDADYYEFDKYDPHYSPQKPKGKYDTVLCHFVLNVLGINLESKVLKKLKKYIKRGGDAYITVRRDLRKEGYTKKGTYQRKVYLALPIIYEDSDICIYHLPNYNPCKGEL